MQCIKCNANVTTYGDKYCHYHASRIFLTGIFKVGNAKRKAAKNDSQYIIDYKGVIKRRDDR